VRSAVGAGLSVAIAIVSRARGRSSKLSGRLARSGSALPSVTTEWQILSLGGTLLRRRGASPRRYPNRQSSRRARHAELECEPDAPRVSLWRWQGNERYMYRWRCKPIARLALLCGSPVRGGTAGHPGKARPQRGGRPHPIIRARGQTVAVEDAVRRLRFETRSNCSYPGGSCRRPGALISPSRSVRVCLVHPREAAAA
jgi:hypothetical protein